MFNGKIKINSFKQLLDFEVDFINSVQFSNHTQYKIFKGQRLNSNELSDLFDGLRENNLLNYTHLLTGIDKMQSSSFVPSASTFIYLISKIALGYVGDPTFLNKLADLIEEIKAINPELIYCEFLQMIGNV